MFPSPFPSLELFLTDSNPFWLYLLSGTLLPLLGVAALFLLILSFASSVSSDSDNRRVILFSAVIMLLSYQELGQNEVRAARLYGALYNRSEYIEEFQKAKMSIISENDSVDPSSLDTKREKLEALVKNRLMNKAVKKVGK